MSTSANLTRSTNLSSPAEPALGQSSLKVAAIQHSIVWEDPPATFLRVAPLIEEAAGGGAKLVCLTEMFSAGFSMASDKIAEQEDGPSASFLIEQASKYDVWTCASVPTRSPDYERPVNRLIVCDGNGIVAHYDKIHPFRYAGEDQHYDPGTGLLTLDLDGVQCTFFICYDLRFVTDFWDTAAVTDLYVVVANWPAARRQHWQTLLRARAIENQAYVLAVNRVGEDNNGLAYGGDSALIDPLGKTLLHAAEIETALVGDVSAAHVAEVRAKFPFHLDR